ncbi:hypothetical protein CcCBS67573_g09398 [Chytriomyces confervae]|uniref:Uncharacterized protein n=1 Tax=Chytriomyces confervae TaxID=246404 RepID=A0A507DWA4_9FUNG|nr:hypothetical protein CcCBS67573_g09398 [Chytriomyces confervae]
MPSSTIQQDYTTRQDFHPAMNTSISTHTYSTARSYERSHSHAAAAAAWAGSPATTTSNDWTRGPITRTQHADTDLLSGMAPTSSVARPTDRDPYNVLSFLDNDNDLDEFDFEDVAFAPVQRPAHIQIPTSFTPSRHASIDYSIDGSYSPSSSPTRPILSPTSAPSSRHNSVDFDAGVFETSANSSRKSIIGYYNNNTISEPLSPILSSSPAPLQATGGGTASITPALAVELTKAQMKLSMLKKQKDSIPPNGYVCRLCAIEGHWMENCILYKSNKHPQYNNAARAVALNIITPGSQVVLNSLPVVSQPQVQYTPKFVSSQQPSSLQQQHMHHQQQLRQQLLQQQQQQLQRKQQELQYQQQFQHQQIQQKQMHDYYSQVNHAQQYRQQMFRPNSPESPTSSGSYSFRAATNNRSFEQIWMDN